MGFLLDYLDREEFKTMAYGEFTVNDLLELKDKEIARSREEGREEGELKSARSLYNNGFSVEQISKLLGIEISKLAFLNKQ